jgi:hypothetical protein
LGLVFALAWFQSAPRYDQATINAARIAPSEQNAAPLITGRSVAVSPLRLNHAEPSPDRKRDGVGAMGFARR